MYVALPVGVGLQYDLTIKQEESVSVRHLKGEAVIKKPKVEAFGKISKSAVNECLVIQKNYIYFNSKMVRLYDFNKN